MSQVLWFTLAELGKIQLLLNTAGWLPVSTSLYFLSPVSIWQKTIALPVIWLVFYLFYSYSELTTIKSVRLDNHTHLNNSSGIEINLEQSFIPWILEWMPVMCAWCGHATFSGLWWLRMKVTIRSVCWGGGGGGDELQIWDVPCSDTSLFQTPKAALMHATWVNMHFLMHFRKQQTHF